MTDETPRQSRCRAPSASTTILQQEQSASISFDSSLYVACTQLFRGSLGKSTSLKDLALSHNQLSEKVPPELGNLSNLESLFLDGNQLTGWVPKVLQGIGRTDFYLLPFC